jgi:hypothetical protein
MHEGIGYAGAVVKEMIRMVELSCRNIQEGEKIKMVLSTCSRSEVAKRRLSVSFLVDLPKR